MINIGEVWLYLDKDSEKFRPALIVKNRMEIDNDVTFVKLSTRESRCEYDIELEKWEEYGLIRSSTVRCSKIYTIKESDLIRKVAEIPQDKMSEIKLKIVQYLIS